MGHLASQRNSVEAANPMTSPPPVQTQICSSPAGPSAGHLAFANGVVRDLTESRSSWIEGIFGCFRPVFWNIAGKANKGV